MEFKSQDIEGKFSILMSGVTTLINNYIAQAEERINQIVEVVKDRDKQIIELRKQNESLQLSLKSLEQMVGIPPRKEPDGENYLTPQQPDTNYDDGATFF